MLAKDFSQPLPLRFPLQNKELVLAWAMLWYKEKM